MPVSETPTPTPDPPKPLAPVERRASGLLQALRRHPEDEDPAQVAQFSTTLVMVCIGVIGATGTMLSISSQRDRPLPHTDFLIASLILGALSLVLILLSLAQLRLGQQLLVTFRRAALSACIFSLVPLLLFAGLNFAQRDSTANQAADLFRVTLDPSIARDLPRTVTPDPEFQAMLRGNSLKPPISDFGGPILERRTSPLAGLARRVAQPMFSAGGSLPGPKEVEAKIKQRLVPELLAVRQELNDHHHGSKYSTVLVEPWTTPELYEFQYYIYGDDARVAAWQSEEESDYLPLFHEWLRGLLTRFILQTHEQPLGAGLAQGDAQVWQTTFDTWFFEHYLPPPSTQFALGILTLPLTPPTTDAYSAPSPALVSVLTGSDSIHQDPYNFWLAPRFYLKLGPLTQEVLQGALMTSIDGTTTSAGIERRIVQTLLFNFIGAGSAIRELHQASRTALPAVDPQTEPELYDFFVWLSQDPLTTEQWQRSDTDHAAPLLLSWLVQLHTRFALYITEDPDRLSRFKQFTADEWHDAYATWFLEHHASTMQQP